ncbi:GNAT family N-acetyltransferase [Streptomyces sp. NPDC001380]|uniref:GNAT family N-acetyltransferase n=1 Tax=Streptomyces sp. NPDC001380 TaxID=3364566 RepID=UPI0036870CC5
MASQPPAPVVLDGRHLRLEPLVPAHVPDLHLAGGSDDEVWRWLPALTPRSEAEMHRVVEQRLAQQAAGEAVLFAVVPRGTFRPVGWTAYLDISVPDERLGIGWNWVARPYRGTALDVEAHLLLLYHAFEVLGFGRVQWQTDHQDYTAQGVLARIGGLREGPLRRHVRRLDGTWRDTVVHSLLAPEWPAVKERIRAGLLP